jgi:hypothetical protein
MLRLPALRFHAARLAAFAAIVTTLIPGASLAATPPTMAEVKAVVQKHLHSKPDYVPGDLISRGDVEPIFDELIPLGVPLSSGQEELYDDFIPDSSPLAKALRSSNGRKFMQQVKTIPNIYDRLERLCWNKHGRELIDQLATDPQGAVLLKAMLEPAGKAALAKFLGDSPSAKNFSLPTGHIYTANQLLKKLDTVLAIKKQK